MGRRWLVAIILTCVGLLPLSVVTASAQDIRAGVEQLAAQVAKAAPEGKQLRVAVADFPDLQGVTSDLGRYIASRLTTRLSQSPKFFVIERQRLGQVLAELKFSMSDLVDPAKAKQLGKMVGVEAILVGTVSDLGNQVDLDARLIEIETNRMLLGATVTISKDPSVTTMLERGRQEPLTVQPALSPQSAPVTAGVQSRKVGDITFTVKRVIVSKGVVTVMLDILNHSEKELKLATTQGVRPGLADNKGNRFEYPGDEGGLISTWSRPENWRTLTPKSNNDLTLRFTPVDRDLNIKEIGSTFTFTLNYYLYDSKDKSSSNYEVGFTEIKSQLPN